MPIFTIGQLANDRWKDIERQVLEGSPESSTFVQSRHLNVRKREGYTSHKTAEVL